MKAAAAAAAAVVAVLRVDMVVDLQWRVTRFLLNNSFHHSGDWLNNLNPLKPLSSSSSSSNSFHHPEKEEEAASAAMVETRRSSASMSSKRPLSLSSPSSSSSKPKRSKISKTDSATSPSQDRAKSAEPAPVAADPVAELEKRAEEGAAIPIANADTEVLVEVVRLIQKLGLKGVKGGWKDFLNSHDPKLGSGLSDPAKRSRDILVAFLESCQWKNRKFISKLVGRFSSQRAMEQFIKEFQALESPHQRLVRMTFEHPQYKQHYSFPSLDEEWMVVPLGKIIEAMKSKNMIAVDCEMVGCEDGTEAVVRVCAVDQTLKVIIDEKVNPGKAIANYRTEITGIAAEDLEGVTCSLCDIQKSLKKLLAHGTILIGHGLHNDLQALKTDHLRVIDTSYIFKCEGLPPPYTPSLNNLCEAVLGYKIRKEGETHDCRNDALAAMKLVLAKLGHGSDDPIAVAAKKVSEHDLSKLLLHKIPVNTPCQELHNAFPLEYSIDIQPDLRVRNQFYSTFAVFKDAGEADAAFRQIEGQENKDLCGRLQKLVSLKLGTGPTINFHIRKMEADVMLNGSELSKKRSAVEDDNQDSKRQRICLHQCDHAKEIDAKQIGHAKDIEILKQKLREREDEIFTLQKMLSVLIEKHGL